MKKLHFVLATAVLTFSATSSADIRVTDTQNGAWVKVTDNGQPAVNATVSLENYPQVGQTFQTGENGRVFIPISVNNSRSIKFKAVTQEGIVYSRFAFHSDSKR
ncbi:hypothetical protein MD588_02460 [Photobacterium sp. SDRW27]|uniref:hypothetical protein n=1 Tax=Photobacterium obscurum TaxID=2829490 RepID=UPI002242E7DC|nr:hypothetical protein [Photobacterium obscurum]MCW8327657.1 hypothetical protein [Photobacterium obscurum]